MMSDSPGTLFLLSFSGIAAADSFIPAPAASNWSEPLSLLSSALTMTAVAVRAKAIIPPTISFHFILVTFD